MNKLLFNVFVSCWIFSMVIVVFLAYWWPGIGHAIVSRYQQARSGSVGACGHLGVLAIALLLASLGIACCLLRFYLISEGY